MTEYIEVHTKITDEHKKQYFLLQIYVYLPKIKP